MYLSTVSSLSHCFTAGSVEPHHQIVCAHLGQFHPKKKRLHLQGAWGVSILVSLPVLLLILQKPAVGLGGPHTELLLGAACIGSVFAELFMIKSLLVFDPARRPSARERAGKERAAKRVERVERVEREEGVENGDDSEADVEPDEDEDEEESVEQPPSPKIRWKWVGALLKRWRTGGSKGELILLT
jgi:hypothetical protein